MDIPDLNLKETTIQLFFTCCADSKQENEGLTLGYQGLFVLPLLSVLITSMFTTY